MPNEQNPTTIHVSATIHGNAAEKLKLFARKTGATKASIVKIAVEAFLAEREKK